MPTLRQRFRNWRGPSRADLATQVQALQTQLQQNRFTRFNPVASGVPMTYGAFEYEQNEKMRTPEKWDQLDRLALDPHVRGSLRNVVFPLVNAEWEIEPASDDARDEEIAEFVAANLLRQSGEKYGSEFFSQTSWQATRLREILDMLESGYAVFSKSTKIVNGKRLYDRIQWLEPSSVDPRGWVLNEQDEIEGIQRTFSTPGGAYRFEEPIEARQLFMYVWDLKGARYEGRPFIRPMFGAWMRKEFKQKMSAILAQKLGAPMPYGWYPKGFPENAIPALKDAVAAMRGTNAAESMITGPMGDDNTPPDLGYVGAEHNLDRGFTDIIDSENREIGHAGGSTSSNLGETESGSRALGESKGLMEMVLVEAVVAIVSEFETHGMANLPGPIEELVDWNFAGVTKYPKLVANKVNPFSIQRGFEDTVKAWEKGIIPKTPDARRQIVETNLGLNLPDEQYDVQEPPPFVPGQAPPGANGSDAPPNGDREQADDEPGAALSLESIEDFRARIAPLLEPMEGRPARGGFRRPNRLELEACDLAAVQQSFRVGERDILMVLQDISVSMVGDLMRRLRGGQITEKSLDKQYRSKYRNGKRDVAKLSGVLGDVAESGADDVENELERQDG